MDINIDLTALLGDEEEMGEPYKIFESDCETVNWTGFAGQLLCSIAIFRDDIDNQRQSSLSNLDTKRSARSTNAFYIW